MDDEETYTNINKAKNTMREKLFKFEHLSYYNKIDIDSSDECRSILPSGLLLSIANNVNCVNSILVKHTQVN